MKIEQWTRRYRYSLKIAATFNSDFRFDIVHNAWLRYFDKEGVDLFDIELKDENSFLYTIIKRAFFWWNYKERKGTKYQYLPVDILTSKFADPLERLIASDLLDIMKGIVAEDHLKMVLQLKGEGYKQTDIAERLGWSKQLINQYNKKIECRLRKSAFTT